MRDMKADRKVSGFHSGTWTQHAALLKQLKLLLTAVWPTEIFQQLDSIRGFLKGGWPHPHCMSHFLTHIHKELDHGFKKRNQGQTLP